MAKSKPATDVNEADRDYLTAVRTFDGDLDHRLRELGAVRERMGTTAASHLRWLLDFANGAPPQAGEAARRVSAEIGALVRATCRPIMDDVIREKPGSPKQIDHLQKLHAELREEILGPALDGRWVISSNQLGDYELVIDHGNRFYHGSEETLFILACYQLLTSPEARRISHCASPKCDHWFLRRKRGIYCSAECAAEAKSTRYFATPVETRSERRHQAYKNSVTSRLGKRVKVHRRGPRPAKNSEVQID
jgi:hypothetical protein